MIKAGKLRRKITIQENQHPLDELGKAQRDVYGAPIDNWVDVWTCRASMEPLSGREYFASAQVQAEQMTRFRIRYPRFQLWPGMRVKYHDFILNADRYFDINAVIDQNEMHVEVFIMATEQIKPVAVAGGGSSSGSSYGASSDGGADSGESSGDEPVEPTSPYYPVGSDCVLYLAFWDGTTADHSIYGNHGTKSGGTSFVPNGLHFDGVDGAVSVLIVGGSLDPGLGDYTNLAWMYAATGETGTAPLALIVTPAYAPSIYTWRNPTGYPYINVWYDASSNRYFEQEGYAVSHDAWHLIASVVDRDVGGYLSIDGAALIGPSGPTDTVTDFSGFTQRFAGGIYQYTYAAGTLGENLCFKRALSSADILAYFNATKARYGL